MSVLTTENHDAIRVITLNRPEKRNALNHELTSGLIEALETAEADEDIRAVILAGNGKGFCAGADLGEFASLTPDNADLVAKRAALTCRLQSVIATMGKPVVAAVQGAAIGGGGGLALSADMLVVSEDAKLGFPELKHSIVPALVMPNVVRHFGRKLGFELVSTGRILTAHELLLLGAANKVTPLEGLMDAAFEVAEIWAKSEPRAMAAAKKLYYAVSEEPPAEAFDRGREVNREMRSFRK